MKAKICACCKMEINVCCFYKNKNKKDGYDSICKECKKIKRRKYIKTNEEKIKLHRKNVYLTNKEKHKEYREKNKEIIKTKDKIRREKNKEIITARRKKYYKKNLNSIKEYQKNYYENNRNKVISRQKKYQESHKTKRNKRHKVRIFQDSLYKFKCNIRSLIHGSLKNKHFKKNTKTEQILGCSLEFFKQYIENQFNEWQNWNNWGIFKKNEVAILNKYWSIDHIIPLSSAKTKEEIIKLNHYTNLCVLDSYINQYLKKDKVTYCL